MSVNITAIVIIVATNIFQMTFICIVIVNVICKLIIVSIIYHHPHHY